MPRQITDIFPPPETLLNMEPEEVAGFLLEFLNDLPGHALGILNLYHLAHPQGALAPYARLNIGPVARVIAEAWTWLLREGMIAPRPDTQPQDDLFFVTRRGKRFKAHADLETYRKAGLLHDETLDLLLAAKVVPLFRRGD